MAENREKPSNPPQAAPNRDSNSSEQREKLAEEARRKEQKRIRQHEMMMAFIAHVPPSFVGKSLNKFSNESVGRFVGSLIAEFSDDLLPEFSNWAIRYLKSLEEHCITNDIDRLKMLGVKREPIALSMTFIKFAPRLDASFARLGSKRERRKRAKALLTSVPVLNELATIIGDVPALLWKEIPDPSRIASELKMLSSMLTWGAYLYEVLGANSFLEVSKFALASLVHAITGKYLDREVSNLTGAALDDAEYDETRHRVWRITNYERLQANIPIVTRVLISLNTVLPDPTNT